MKRSQRGKILSGDKVPLRLTLEDRDLLVEHALMDEETMRPLCAPPPEGGKLVLYCTLNDLEMLAGAVAAEANYAKSKKLQKRLDAICDKITDTLRFHDAATFDDSAPR